MGKKTGFTWQQVVREADLLHERLEQHPQGVLLSTVWSVAPANDALGYLVAGPFTLSEIQGNGRIRGLRLKEVSTVAMLAVTTHQVRVIHEDDTWEVALSDCKVTDAARSGKALLLTVPGQDAAVDLLEIVRQHARRTLISRHIT